MEDNIKEKKVISEALDGLQKEIGVLDQQRKTLETKMKHLSDSIVVTQAEESKLREEISGLVGKEGLLDRKRNSYKDKLSSLQSKIAKVKKIRQELFDF
ncbi:MAG: hypothetical protein O2779_04855 [Nanoarchaeota archaeon]|nr:hypothetical protein [Nanoarchaeota archaeon]